MTANTQSQAIVRVVDDDPDVRRSWQFVIEGEGWNVLTYASALEFLEKDSPFTPGCLVLDVRMPGMSGIELQHEMKLRGDTLPIIFISAHGDIDMAVKTMKDGADDFLSKPVTPERLLDAIEKAVKRDARIRTESAALEQARAAFRRLSAREQEVATGVARGLLNKQIAYELNISEKTVIAHRSSLCKKLGARTAADITRMLMTIDPDAITGAPAPADGELARGSPSLSIPSALLNPDKKRAASTTCASKRLFVFVGLRSCLPVRRDRSQRAVRGESARSSPRRAPRREGEAHRRCRAPRPRRQPCGCAS